MIRPLVNATSSRICVIPSQPARLTAGPTNFEQMSRSLRSFLLIEVAVIDTSVLPTLLTDQAASVSPKSPRHMTLVIGAAVWPVANL